MPATKPKYMDEVRTNSSGLFVALYYLSEKVDDASVAVDKWFWLRSNASGVRLDERDNKIPVNGASWWSEKSTALANTPSGYGAVFTIDAFQNRREWGYMPAFPFESGFSLTGDNVSLNNAFKDIRQFVDAGATYVAITLNWDEVFLSLSEQNANADSSWVKYDAFFNFVKNLNNTTKVAIRVSVYKAGRTHNDMQGTYNATGNFWPLSKAQKDNRGNVMRNIYDRGTFSYSDSNAVSQAIDFLIKVKNRYSALFGSRLLWISVATTTQEEAGYDFENNWDGSNYISPQSRVYDYSDAGKAGFEAYVLAKYGSLSAVNSAWGLSSTTSITPPLPPSDSTEQSISLVYSGVKGNDWWYFNYSVMKAFHTSCKAVIGTSCKYVLEFGSCTDPLSIRRLSINVSDFLNYSDMIKAQFLSLPSDTNTGISVDVIRANYTKKIGTELNTGDFSQYTGEGNITNFIKNGGISAIDNKALDILMISSSTSSAYNKQAYDDTFNAFVFLKNYAQNSSNLVVASKIVYYSITQQLNDSTFLLNRWQQKEGNSTRIDMKISDTSVITDSIIYKSVFTFNQKTNGNTVPTSGTYVNGYLQFWAFSHGVVVNVPDPVLAKKGQQCKLEYTIKNFLNEIVINLKDNYGGFHPNFQNFSGDANTNPAESYYRVWTPAHEDYENLKWIRDYYNNFTPISGTPFNSAVDRGNNHFSQYHKYLVEGDYTLTIKNTGLFPINLRAGKTDTLETLGVADVYTTIPANNMEYNFTLHVRNYESNQPYKINAYI
jgi:hypothetical protein